MMPEQNELMEQALSDKKKSDLAEAVERVRRDRIPNNLLARSLNRLAIRLLQTAEEIEGGEVDAGTLGRLKGFREVLDGYIDVLEKRIYG
jgi:hypothetical protein